MIDKVQYSLPDHSSSWQDINIFFFFFLLLQNFYPVWANSADGDIFFFLYFSQKIGFDMPPDNLHDLFSGKNKKNILKELSAEFFTHSGKC